MSTLFFNTQYKIMNSLSDFQECIDYYDRNDRADKNLLNQKDMNDKEADDMFSYYFYRKGSSGCFDSLGDKSYEEIMDEYQSYQPSYIWRSIVSFTREDAIEFGLNTKKDFAALTRKIVVKMAEEKGISLRDVAWGGFYHTNTDHPHVHFYFYDKRNPLDKSLFTSKSIKKIRSAIGHEVIDRSLLLKTKEDASRNVLLNMREIMNDDIFLKQLKEYRVNRTERSEKFINPKFKISAEVFKQFQRLNEILPKEGRLSYNAHTMKNYKQDIDYMIKIILTQQGLSDDYSVFLRTLDEVHISNEKLYGEGNKKSLYVEDQKNRLYANLGNAILKMLKVYRNYSYEQDELHFEKYMSIKDIRKENIRLMQPYGYDLMRFAIKHMAKEISHMRYMYSIRYREQHLMLKEVEKENREKQDEENEVKYAAS